MRGQGPAEGREAIAEWIKWMNIQLHWFISWWIYIPPTVSNLICRQDELNWVNRQS
jgi:hypothetical protein